jgi:hypothetical protein
MPFSADCDGKLRPVWSLGCVEFLERSLYGRELFSDNNGKLALEEK